MFNTLFECCKNSCKVGHIWAEDVTILRWFRFSSMNIYILTIKIRRKNNCFLNKKQVFGGI